MPHQLYVPVKHEHEETEDRPTDLWENCCDVPSSVAVNPIIEGSLFSSMAIYNNGCQAGEDESLTEMMTESTIIELYHPNNATHQRNVSFNQE